MKMISNAGFVAAEFAADSVVVREGTRATLIHHGQLLQTRVMAKASGRPGPNIVTGDYRRSIGLEEIFAPGITAVSVGTNAPQGARLEFGFHGTDSLGRHYDQPPYPHFGPAVDEIVPGLVKDLEKVAGLEIRR